MLEATEVTDVTLSTYSGILSPARQVPMDIVAGVLHELQNPIAAILIAAENIRDGLLEDRDQLREEGTLIVAHATRLMILGDQILSYARTGKPESGRDICALSADEVINHAVNGVAALLRQREFTLECDIQNGLPLLRGDLQLLSQCLENLISNAVKYSGRSRWIGVSAVLAESALSGQEEIRIGICDRGLGISAEDLPRIFEPFYRSRRPGMSAIRGSGLGLSIAKGCAEACGGSLSLVSQEGAGCAFTVHLPLHGASAEEARQQVGATDAGEPICQSAADQSGPGLLPVESIGQHLFARAECCTLQDEPSGEHSRMRV